MAGGDRSRTEPSPGRAAKTGRLMWAVAVTFVSAWMFFLGVLVGRGTAPIRYDLQELKKQLAQAKASLFEDQVRRYKIPAESQEAPSDLSFYDALRETRKSPGMKRETRQPQKTEAPVKPSEPVGKAPTASVGENGAKDSGGQGPQPAPVPEATGKPLTLQVASFPSPADARKLAEDLKKRGFPAYLQPVMIPGKGVWYRVRVGFFESQEKASNLMDQLRRERFQPIVVNRNTQ